MSQIVQDALDQLDNSVSTLIAAVNNAPTTGVGNDDAAVASRISAAATHISNAVANLAGKSF